MIRTILPARLLLLRNIHKLSQYQLARDADISRNCLNRIERGKAEDLTVQTLLKLCRVFKVSPDYLLGFDQNEQYVRSLLHADRLVYFTAEAKTDMPTKCPYCDHILTPDVPHPMSECMVFMSIRGRSDEWIAQRYGWDQEAVEWILEHQLKQLRENTNHR